MFRFTRTATLKQSAYVPQALAFSKAVDDHLRNNYQIELRSGMELFGGNRVHWTFETPSLDAITELNARLIADNAYMALLAEYKDIWIDGSVDDTIVSLLD